MFNFIINYSPFYSLLIMRATPHYYWEKQARSEGLGPLGTKDRSDIVKEEHEYEVNREGPTCRNWRSQVERQEEEERWMGNCLQCYLCNLIYSSCVPPLCVCV